MQKLCTSLAGLRRHPQPNVARVFTTDLEWKPVLHVVPLQIGVSSKPTIHNFKVPCYSQMSAVLHLEKPCWRKSQRVKDSCNLGWKPVVLEKF